LKDLPLTTPLSQEDVASILQAEDLAEKVRSLLSFMLQTQGAFLASLCKFSYLTQRIFVYLIHQGFCGKDDQEDNGDEQGDDEMQAGEGCGMGEGQGQKNVSNEIEHEEQLEGLKDYASDEEK